MCDCEDGRAWNDEQGICDHTWIHSVLGLVAIAGLVSLGVLLCKRRKHRREEQNMAQYDPNSPENRAAAVEEKFGEHNFRVLSEMRGKILYCNPKQFKIFNKMMSDTDTDSTKI